MLWLMACSWNLSNQSTNNQFDVDEQQQFPLHLINTQLKWKSIDQNRLDW